MTAVTLTSVIPAVAEAVKDAINAASESGALSKKVTAVRKWLPAVELQDIDGIFVLVIAKSIDSTIATRAKDWSDVSIDVGFFMKLTNEGEADADELFGFMQEISGVLRPGLAQVLPGVDAGWQQRTSDPIFDVTTMQTTRVLRSATTYRFKVYHDVEIGA
jgi:hypothetical protein